MSTLDRDDYVVIEGKYATAKVFLPEDELEENTRDQIQEMVDHPAIRGEVRVMPDTHVGAGSVIGFTMPLDSGDTLRVVPNIVGVDVGCGMKAINLGKNHRLAEALDGEVDDETAAEIHETIDREIRDRIPFGFSVHGRNDYHMGEDYPHDTAAETLNNLGDALGVDFHDEVEWFDGYGLTYFKELCKRVEYVPQSNDYGQGRAIDSVGTLGGGNHFIELAISTETGDLWAIIHSGSRGIGAAIAEHWQQKAHELHDDRAERIRGHLAAIKPEYYKFDLMEVENDDLRTWVTGGKGEDFKNMDAVAADYSDTPYPELIEGVKDNLMHAATIANEDIEDDLNWLEGELAYGYLIDMVFAQRYASESRDKMARAVADVLDAGVQDEIESVHNFIDFEDVTIRKGACPAREGQRIVIPYNMRDGTIIAEGKGNDEWNQSAPHGAGRVMSRGQAFDDLDMGEFEETMDGVFSTSVTEDTLDEAPFAYKKMELIENAIEPTADLIDRLKPVHNLKAED